MSYTEKQNAPQDLKRTNVRLPREVHAALKKAAIERGLPIEQIVLNAVERELGFSESPASIRTSNERRILQRTLNELKRMTVRAELDLKRTGDCIDPLQPAIWGEQYLECMPFPVVVKKASDTTIVWSNRAYGNLLQEPRTNLIGRTLQQVLPALRPDDPTLEHVRSLGGGNQFHCFCEVLPIKSRDVWLVTYRFLFTDPGGEIYIGDLSFPNDDLERAKASNGPVLLNAYPGVSLSSKGNDQQEIAEVLGAFLDQLTVVAVLKSPEGKIRWYDEPFATLAAPKTAEQILGHFSGSVFDLPDDCETHRYDRRVVEEGVAILGRETILGEARIAVHFPIFKRDRIEYIGVVSSEAKEMLGLLKQPLKQTRRRH